MKKTLFIVGLALLGFTVPVLAGPRTINLCTGAEGGAYNVAGKMIAEMAKGDPNIAVHVVADTGGTWGNIQKTALGDECDAMIGQPDGVALLKRQNGSAAAAIKPIADLHREFLHVLCSKESGISNLSSLDKSNSVALGNTGSGAWLIWQNFIAMDSDYGNVPVKNEDGVVALSAVASNQTTCMLVPAAIGYPLVQQADQMFGDNLVLAGATDGSFNDATDPQGKPLYEFEKIPSGTYPNALQTGWFSGAKTISWLAKVYINTDRLNDQKVLSSFITATVRAKPAIQAQFGK